MTFIDLIFKNKILTKLYKDMIGRGKITSTVRSYGCDLDITQ